MSAPSWLEIDLDRLTGNVTSIRALLSGRDRSREGLRVGSGPALIAATIKADAYGIGIEPIARHLAPLVDWFAVYSPDQAIALARLTRAVAILVYMPVEAEGIRVALDAARVCGKRVHFTIHDQSDVGVFADIARRIGASVNVHVYLDTGMNRAGIRAEDLAPVIDDIRTSGSLRLSGVYTHFSSAESDGPITLAQAQRFDDAVGPYVTDLSPDGCIHIANSAGLLRDVGLQRDLVRPGLLLWGYAIDAMVDGSLLSRDSVLPILRWRSRIVHTRTVAAGSSVGYAGTEVVGRDAVLGIVPVGYGDGYPLALSGRGVVTFANRPTLAARVVGRVNMDQLIVDLTGTGAVRGDLVEIYSADVDAPNSLPRLADLATAHCYELLCRLTPRIERRIVRFTDQ